MEAHPILFRPRLVRAILECRKTQTRRLLNHQPHGAGDWVRRGMHWLFPNVCPYIEAKCPYGQPGDLLWVRETFYVDLLPWADGGRLPDTPTPDMLEPLYYAADGSCCQQIPECACVEVGKPRWRPSIHMPRWASRVTLLVTDVRVERVQDINGASALAEGVSCVETSGGCPNYFHSAHGEKFPEAREAFRDLWDSNNRPGRGWASNPWVWVIEFRPILANVDTVLADPSRYGIEGRAA